jgi:hypothetical protein
MKLSTQVVGMTVTSTKQRPCCIHVSNVNFSKDIFMIIGLELHVPMFVVQLDGYAHTNATISLPCL